MFFQIVLTCILLYEFGDSTEVSPEICRMVVKCGETSTDESLIIVKCSGRGNLFDTYSFNCINRGYPQYSYYYDSSSRYLSLQILPFNNHKANNPPFQLIADNNGEIFNNFHTLIISNLELKIIPDGFFYPFRELRVLDLSFNHLTLSDNAQLNFLHNLEALYLSNNDICAVNESFQNFPNLKILDLSFNKIRQLPEDLLMYNVHLEQILLTNNEIVNFDVNVADYKGSYIDFIDLSYNQLEDIGTIANLSQNLNYLALAHNNLSIFNVNFTSSITHLDLSHNRLKEISEYVIINATNIVSINISQNLIESLPISSFRNLRNLKTLDISNNLISRKNVGVYNSWLSFFLHFQSLENVALDGNMWDCEDLKDIIFSTASRSVKVKRGSVYNKSNILGIYCIQGNTSSHENSSTEVSSNVISKVLEEVWIRLENVTRLADASQFEKNTFNKILQISTKMNDTEVQLNNTIDAQQTVLKDITSRLEKLEAQVNNSGTHSKTNKSSLDVLNIEQNGSQINQDTLNKIVQISREMHDKEEQLNITMQEQQTVLKGIISIILEKLEILSSSIQMDSKLNQTFPEDVNVELHGSQINQDTLNKILQISTKMNDTEVQLNNTIDAQQTVLKDITSRLEKLEAQVNNSGTHSKTNKSSLDVLNIEQHGSQINQDTLNKILQISTKMHDKEEQLNNSIQEQQTILKGIISIILEKLEILTSSIKMHSKLNQTFPEDVNVELHGSQVDTLKQIPEVGTRIDKSNSYVNDTLIEILSSVKIILLRLMEHMEQQAKSSGAFSKNNQTSLEESTLLKNFIFSINSLTDKIGAENMSELEQVKEELRLLKYTEDGTYHGIWGEVILDLLLLAILSALLYSLYVIVIRKTTLTREEVTLAQTL